jgi:hypothetical protein
LVMFRISGPIILARVSPLRAMRSIDR